MSRAETARATPALTYAIKARVSTAATPVTGAAALHAVKLVRGFLAWAAKDSRDHEVREMMIYVGFLAVMASNNASLGYV